MARKATKLRPSLSIYLEILGSNLDIQKLYLPLWKHVRHGSHWGGSPQNVLGDERTRGMTLASAYVLHRLSAVWSQLQMKERSPSGSEC